MNNEIKIEEEYFVLPDGRVGKKDFFGDIWVKNELGSWQKLLTSPTNK